MEIYFIRHGESMSNARGVMEGWGDSELSERGLEQARLVARKMAALGSFDSLFCSPLSRARITARAIGRAIGIEPVSADELREIHIGRWDGHPLPDLKLVYHGELERWAQEDHGLIFPGGECLGHFYDRAKRALDHIISTGGSRIIVVAHGCMISACLTSLLEGRASSKFGISLANCSLSAVKISHGECETLLFNDVAHLNESA